MRVKSQNHELLPRKSCVDHGRWLQRSSRQIIDRELGLSWWMVCIDHERTKIFQRKTTFLLVWYSLNNFKGIKPAFGILKIPLVDSVPASKLSFTCLCISFLIATPDLVIGKPPCRRLHRPDFLKPGRRWIGVGVGAVVIGTHQAFGAGAVLGGC